MIRVLVADDSAFSRVTLSKMMEKDPSIKVVATAVNGEEAVRLAMAHQPDLITLDLEMPGMDGFSVLRWLASNRPTPTIVISSRGGREDVFRALDLGAVDFILKPSAHATQEYSQMETILLEKIRAVARARPPRPVKLAREPAPLPPSAPGGGLVVIGASTGGPAAVASVFSSLPKLPAPVVLAQHMPAGFTSIFAERLHRISAFPVREAGDRETLDPGKAYVAPGGMHLEIEGQGPAFVTRLLPRSAEDLYSPSVDRLFESAARCAGARCVAVVLTGMGSDGRAGIVAVRKAGGRTVAESEETAVIFGMPREAAQTGSVEEIRPLSEIPGAITRLLTEMSAHAPHA